MSLRGAGAFDHHGVVGGDFDLLDAAEVCDLEGIKFHSEVLHDRGRTREGRDVLEHGLASITVARGLHGTDLKHASELVDDQRREGFAGDVLGDDQQRLLRRHDLLEERDELRDVVDLVLMDEDQWLLENDLHRLGVGDEVRAQVAAIELHAFHDVDLGLPALAFFDRDHAFLADPLETPRP